MSTDDCSQVDSETLRQSIQRHLDGAKAATSWREMRNWTDGALMARHELDRRATIQPQGPKP